LKEVWKKRELRKRDDMMLQEICLKMNNHLQGEKGSAAERFLKRKPRVILLGSI